MNRAKAQFISTFLLVWNNRRFKGLKLKWKCNYITKFNTDKNGIAFKIKNANIYRMCFPSQTSYHNLIVVLKRLT